MEEVSFNANETISEEAPTPGLIYTTSQPTARLIEQNDHLSTSVHVSDDTAGPYHSQSTSKILISKSHNMDEIVDLTDDEPVNVKIDSE